MSAQAKRGRNAAQDDGDHTRKVKERRIEIVVSKVETQLFAGFNKLHSTQILLGQAKANLEMVGGLVCRQKEQLQHIVSQLHAARKGPTNNIPSRLSPKLRTNSTRWPSTTRSTSSAK